MPDLFILFFTMFSDSVLAKAVPEVHSIYEKREEAHQTLERLMGTHKSGSGFIKSVSELGITNEDLEPYLTATRKMTFTPCNPDYVTAWAAEREKLNWRLAYKWKPSL